MYHAVLLRVGGHLTRLDLFLRGDWHAAAGDLPFPKRVRGAPLTSAVILSVSEYEYMLDAAIMWMPCLTELLIDGPLASTALFSHLPPSLKVYVHSTCISVL